MLIQMGWDVMSLAPRRAPRAKITPLKVIIVQIEMFHKFRNFSKSFTAVPTIT